MSGIALPVLAVGGQQADHRPAGGTDAGAHGQLAGLLLLGVGVDGAASRYRQQQTNQQRYQFCCTGFHETPPLTYFRFTIWGKDRALSFALQRLMVITT
jgi:hypothetical protein